MTNSFIAHFECTKKYHLKVCFCLSVDAVTKIFFIRWPQNCLSPTAQNGSEFYLCEFKITWAQLSLLFTKPVINTTRCTHLWGRQSFLWSELFLVTDHGLTFSFFFFTEETPERTDVINKRTTSRRSCWHRKCRTKLNTVRAVNIFANYSNKLSVYSIF